MKKTKIKKSVRRFLNEENESLGAYIIGSVKHNQWGNCEEVCGWVRITDCSNQIELDFNNDFSLGTDAKQEDKIEQANEFHEKHERMLRKFDVLIDSLIETKKNYQECYEVVSQRVQKMVDNM